MQAGTPFQPQGPNLCSLCVSLTDAIYDCSSLYQKNYRISGVYKLPPDEFLGTPELEVRSLLPCPTLCPPALKGTGTTGLWSYESAQLMGH